MLFAAARRRESQSQSEFHALESDLAVASDKSISSRIRDARPKGKLLAQLHQDCVQPDHGAVRMAFEGCQELALTSDARAHGTEDRQSQKVFVECTMLEFLFVVLCRAAYSTVLVKPTNQRAGRGRRKRSVPSACSFASRSGSRGAVIGESGRRVAIPASSRPCFVADCSTASVRPRLPRSD